MTEREFLQLVEKAGWLGAMPPEEQRALRKRVADAIAYLRKYETDPTHDHLIAAWGYQDLLDDEINGKEPWTSWLNAYRQWSCGVFDPVKVLAKRRKGSDEVDLAFEYRGRAVKGSVTFEPDSSPDGLLALANAALREAGIEQRFLPVFGWDTTAVVFVTPALYRKARQTGLLPTKGRNSLTGAPVLVPNPLDDPDFQ